VTRPLLQSGIQEFQKAPSKEKGHACYEARPLPDQGNAEILEVRLI
jgi:hypothetical protein